MNSNIKNAILELEEKIRSKEREISELKLVKNAKEKHLKIDVNIPFYLYNCPLRKLSTKINLQNYSRIVDLCLKKYNVELTLTIIGSEKEVSRNFIKENFKKNYTYHEFDQKSKIKGTNYDEHVKNGFFNILAEKFKFSYECSMKKNPNITLLAGSNDFISFNFFEQIIKFYNKNEKQIYGIGGREGNNKALYTYVDQNNKLSKEMYWTTGEMNDRNNAMGFKYIGGIIGFNDNLYKSYYEDISRITNSVDEGAIERELFKLNGVKRFLSKNCYYVNVKTKSNSDITPFNALMNTFRMENSILDYNSFDKEFKKRFEKEYLSNIIEYYNWF